MDGWMLVLALPAPRCANANRALAAAAPVALAATLGSAVLPLGEEGSGGEGEAGCL